MILTHDELCNLTKRTRKDAQAKVLSYMGIDFIKRPDGSVAVSAARVESLLGMGSQSKTIKEVEPKWKEI